MFSNSYPSAPLLEAPQLYIALRRQPFAELSGHPAPQGDCRYIYHARLDKLWDPLRVVNLEHCLLTPLPLDRHRAQRSRLVIDPRQSNHHLHSPAGPLLRMPIVVHGLSITASPPSLFKHSINTVCISPCSNPTCGARSHSNGNTEGYRYLTELIGSASKLHLS